MTRKLLKLASALWIFLGGTGLAAERLESSEWIDLHLAKITIPSSEKKATVLVFLATTCPICNKYAPELGRLADAYGIKGIAFILVETETDLTAAAAIKHAEEYKLISPVVLDPTRKLAKAAGVTATPEAVVLSPVGQVLYRGSIDDRFASLGKDSVNPRSPDLRRALDEVLAGKPVSKPRTVAVGCIIE